MKLNSIQFRQGEAEEGAVPLEITVTMSLVEAVVICKVFGGFSEAEFEKRKLPPIDIYNDLSGDVFNRYWDDGVDDALRDVRGHST